MSDLRPDNGGGVPPDDGAYPGGLPDVPPEWGSIIIPDDAAELEAEAAALRRELRREARRARLRRLAGLGPGGRLESSSIGVPLVIIAVALITTLLSLFVVTWDHRRNATAPVGPEAGQLQGSVPIADVTLPDTTGARVRLGNLVPAILLLVEECDCGGLISSVALATPPPITVVPVAPAAPCSFGSQKNVRCLADPAGVVTGRYPTARALAASATPTAALPATPAGATATTTAPGPVAESVPLVLAIPVDADGTALDPIVIASAADLAGAFAALTASD